MIFSQQVRESTEVKFEALLERAGECRGGEIRTRLAQTARTAPEDVVFAVKWLYANSPLSDMANYDFSIFLSCAEHGVFLRENPLFAEEIPEDIFLNYVLHIRVNEEELCDCRKQFYSQLTDRVRGMAVYDAVLEANYWNAEHVTYQSTDPRTISPIWAYRSAYGRCGEESSFAVNVFRSLGIPARQIYTPRWVHCDDNHAWVEVWCGGTWRFLGACEPEEVLNRGWFTSASSRAMLLHSRCFGQPCAGDEVISKVGMAHFLNNLKLYAATKKLTVEVKDASGRPVDGAEVTFGILNYSNFFPAAVVNTAADGTASLTCGLGSIHIRARKGDAFCERPVFTPDTDRVEMALGTELPECDVWEDFLSIAPRDREVNGVKPTQAQKASGLKKTAAANGKRQRRVEEMFDAAHARSVVEKHGYSQAVYDLLFESRGNLERLLDFLEDDSFSAKEKQTLLLTLSQKDRRDVDPDILREALSLSREYAGEQEEDVFYQYIACPRAFHEPLSKCRQFILDYFPSEQKAAFRADPARAWQYIRENIRFDPSLEYGQIVTKPMGALTVKNASPLSQKILFVYICRALGVAARINPVDQQAEYYAEGRFVPVEGPQRSATLVLEKEPEESWQYYPDFAIGLLADGACQTLDFSREKWEGNCLTLSLKPGFYRIITDNRLPNGDIHASKYHLRLSEGESKTVRLRKQPADLTEMLDNYALDDFTVYDGDGRPVRGSELTKGPAVLMWLQEGMEPTEHLLNEMLEQEAEFRQLPAGIICMVRGPEALENAKLKKVLETFGDIRVCYDSFVPNVETLARRMYVDQEKLPLIIVTTRELNAIYACSGYNVGSAEMIAKVCRLC